ncbi:MAG: hypothetical protein IJT44_03240 [Clostridia bacterium]|nr:hypothetical protein [Clostridia bacterium]
MKRWISTLLVVSLVVGLTAVLHACGKPKVEPETTSSPEDATSIASVEDVGETEDVNDLYDRLESLANESHTHVERTTNEHYEEEYEALTLPQAVTTQPVAGTTRAQSTTNPSTRATTTAFKFEYGEIKTTTKPASTGADTGTTAAKTTTTTTKKDDTAQTTVEETTMLADLVGNNTPIQIAPSNSNASTKMPQVTYLDKYVLDILDSGVYTAQIEQKEGDSSIPVTYYTDGNNSAVEMSMTSMVAQEMGLPSVSLGNLDKIRLVIKDMKTSHPKAYLVGMGGYVKLDDVEDMSDMLSETGGTVDIRDLMQLDYLEYRGVKTGAGYVCETYVIPEAKLQYDLYFTTTSSYSGIARMDIIDMETGKVEERLVLRLSPGVTNKNAFTVKGKEYTLEDMEKLFGG